MSTATPLVSGMRPEDIHLSLATCLRCDVAANFVINEACSKSPSGTSQHGQSMMTSPVQQLPCPADTLTCMPASGAAAAGFKIAPAASAASANAPVTRCFAGGGLEKQNPQAL